MKAKLYQSTKKKVRAIVLCGNCETIIDRLGGEIFITSVINERMTFSFSLEM